MGTISGMAGLTPAKMMPHSLDVVSATASRKNSNSPRTEVSAINIGSAIPVESTFRNRIGIPKSGQNNDTRNMHCSLFRLSAGTRLNYEALERTGKH